MADEPVLTTGDTGEWVTYLQQLLEYKQFGSGFTAGTFDDATAQAVAAAQQQYGLPVTGTTDSATWDALRAENEDDQTPDDIAVSMEDELSAPDDELTLTELDDLPSNVTA